MSGASEKHLCALGRLIETFLSSFGREHTMCLSELVCCWTDSSTKSVSGMLWCLPQKHIPSSVMAVCVWALKAWTLTALIITWSGWSSGSWWCECVRSCVDWTVEVRSNKIYSYPSIHHPPSALYFQVCNLFLLIFCKTPCQFYIYIMSTSITGKMQSYSFLVCTTFNPSILRHWSGWLE